MVAAYFKDRFTKKQEKYVITSLYFLNGSNVKENAAESNLYYPM
jgi:hypothetical protein